MKLWNTLTAHDPASRSPISLKALVYACLTAFFGWAFLWCGINFAFTDPHHNPYTNPAMFAGMAVTCLLLSVVFILWAGAFVRAPRRVLNGAVLALAVVLLAYPSFWLLNALYGLAEDVFHRLLAR